MKTELMRPLLAAGAVLFACAAEAKKDVVISAANGFAGVTGVAQATLTRTPEALVFTDIAYDLQVALKTEPVYPGDVESFEFRYRVTGETSRPKAGGELFYAPLGGAFTDGSIWRIPPLVRDGQWHVMSLPLSSIRNPDDWADSGQMCRFRFDPTNAEGGRLEIGEIRFRMRGSAVRAQASGEKFCGDDAWPKVVPESFKSDLPKREKATPVKAVFLGGTAVPRVQTAGRKVRLRYDYRGEVPKAEFLPGRLTLVTKAGSLKWSEDLTLPLAPSVIRLADDVWALEFDYEVPLYLGAGDCFVRFETPLLRAKAGHEPAAQLSVRRAAVDPDWAKPIVTKTVDVAGSPTFAVNGEPVYPLWGTVSYGRRPNGQPIRHSSAPLTFVTVWTHHLEWWPKGDEFDPTDLDRLAEQHRRAYPGAYFMWDISIYPPPDWRDAHPDEMARDEQGYVNTDCGDAEINFSFASQKAYDDLERVMKKVIAYLEHSPYANRIAGYRINSGHTVEWLGWDPTRKETILDFSPVAQKGFEAFAKEHYPWVTDYSVPTLAERRALDGSDVLWDQRKHARAIAYHDFYSTAVADGAIRMCRAAKEFLGGKKLVGTYFGYVMTLNGGANGQMRAHFATKRFLDAQAVDFVMSPQNYCHASRQPGSQIADMKPFRSIQNHGMVSVIEDDTRTHNLPPNRYCQTLTEEMTVAVLRRNMGVALCRNQPFYTYAITGGFEFDFPRFADDAAALAAAGAHALKAGVRRKAEIAVVMSEEAVKASPMLKGNGEEYVGRSMQAYRPDGTVERFPNVGGPKVAAWTNVYGYDEMARIGAGIDLVLAEDLADNPGDYKLYVMQACTKLTPSLLKAAEKLRERDCTILWTYAPGYVSNDGNSVANMKALTGMDFVPCPDVTDPGVTLADGTKVGSLRNPKGTAPLSPIFAAAKPGKVLGRYSNGAAGLAESRTGKARTVFSGSHYVNAPTLRTIAREAGVHLYSDSLDVLEANERFVLVHVRNAGKKTIRLPRKTSVVSVFERELVAKDVDAFTFEAPLHTSWLFYCADDAEALLRKL